MADNTMTMTDGVAATTADPVDRATVLAHRRSPAHDLVEDMVQGSGAAVSLREIPFLTQLALRTAPASRGGQALAGALEVALPTRVGEVTGAADGSGLAVLWLSPDEFLVVGRDEAQTGVSPADDTANLAEALGAEPGQVLDVSANRTTLELDGPRARSVLEKSCRVDLHPRQFPVGTAIVTLLETTGVIIWRTGQESWRVMPRASFATHVVHWLLDGMREYA